MKTCPKCNTEWGDIAADCLSCGYEFKPVGGGSTLVCPTHKIDLVPDPAGAWCPRAFCTTAPPPPVPAKTTRKRQAT